jgi:hypothetical protein
MVGRGFINTYVHGAETALIHSGLFKGQHVGQIFDSRKLDLWSKQVSEVVEIGLWLTKAKTQIWWDSLRKQLTMCNVCHENTLEEIGAFSFAGTDFLNFRCTRCLHEVAFSKDPRRRVYVVSFEDEPEAS